MVVGVEEVFEVVAEGVSPRDWRSRWEVIGIIFAVQEQQRGSSISRVFDDLFFLFIDRGCWYWRRSY